jgi:transcriptional regulator with XRE-family HTH domain
VKTRAQRYAHYEERARQQQSDNLGELAKLLLTIRLNSRMSLHEFERKSGIKRQTLMLWEKAQRIPTAEFLGRWLAHLPKDWEVDDVLMEIIRRYVRMMHDSIMASYAAEKEKIKRDKKAAAMRTTD